MNANKMAPTFRHHIAIARIDHWFKNIFMLPGVALALVLSNGPVGLGVLLSVVIAVLATSLIASANYTINEWLDAEFDKFHPTKKNRPAVMYNLTGYAVWTQWVILGFAGLSLSKFIGNQFLVFALALLVMGLVYNVKPIRTKDRAYLDVLSESVNNPLRFLLGWSAVISDILPPSSVIIAYWMGGAFLMAAKRYAEFRFINDPQRAGLYRQSFKVYTEEKLLLSSFFYAISSALFLGVFLIKYRVEFLLLFPFLAILFVWYLHIGLSADSVVQRPEQLYKENKFILYLLFLGALTTFLFFVDLPWLSTLVDYHVVVKR